MSYESEERYWTDYLRVALPVIGLLLMLALFWWWAQNFIGDENDPEEQANIVLTQVATTSPPTPTTTVAITVEATEVENTPDPDNPTTSLGGDETPENTGEDCGFSEGDRVLVTDEGDGVNLRADASVDSESLGQLDAGTELIIVGDCFTTEGENDFWNVRVRETAEEGWVAAQFLTPDE
jgi:hypothetical protein